MILKFGRDKSNKNKGTNWNTLAHRHSGTVATAPHTVHSIITATNLRVPNSSATSLANKISNSQLLVCANKTVSHPIHSTCSVTTTTDNKNIKILTPTPALSTLTPHTNLQTTTDRVFKNNTHHGAILATTRIKILLRPINRGHLNSIGKILLLLIVTITNIFKALSIKTHIIITQQTKIINIKEMERIIKINIKINIKVSQIITNIKMIITIMDMIWMHLKKKMKEKQIIKCMDQTMETNIKLKIIRKYKNLIGMISMKEMRSKIAQACTKKEVRCLTDLISKRKNPTSINQIISTKTKKDH